MNVTLDLATVGGPITATAPRDAALDYDSLIDAKVQIRGNAVPVFNGYLQMVGARILFPSHEVRVVQLAPPDPFSTPVIPVARLLWFSPGVVLRHRAHIQGTVTLHWPGRMLCIQSYRGLCMQSPKLDNVEMGQEVDVIGFPASATSNPLSKMPPFASHREGRC
jgi:hypothetical protein